MGIVAAGRINGKKVKEDDDECYWDVKFLTAIPTTFDKTPKGLSVRDIQRIIGNHSSGRERQRCLS